MNDRRMERRVGAVALFTMIIGFLLAAISTPMPTWFRAGRNVAIKVDKAPGVDKDTPVRKNGILIGRVKSIDEQEDGMLIGIKIDADRPLYKEYVPHIRTTVIGDATIDFEFDFKHSRLPANAAPVEDGYVFNGGADESPFDAITKFADLKKDFSDAAHSLDSAGQQVASLANRLNKILGDEQNEGQLNHLVATTDRAMTQFANTMTAFNEIFGDVPPTGTPTSVARPPLNTLPPSNGQPLNNPAPLNTPVPLNTQPLNAPVPLNSLPPSGVQPSVEGQDMRNRLRQSLNEVPDAVRELRITLRDFRVVLESANKNLKNLEGFTEPLGQKGADFAGSMIKAVNGIDQLVTDLTALTQAINNRNGTIGRLLNDDQAYENLNRLMFNFNKVLSEIDDLVFRLKPVVADARIFMDKVATEPGRIISGAVRPSNVK